MSWGYNGREMWGASNYGDPYNQEMAQWRSSAHRFAYGDAQRQTFSSQQQVVRYSNPNGGMASMSAGMQPALQWQPHFQLPAPPSFTNSHPESMSYMPNISGLSLSSSPGKKATGKTANSAKTSAGGPKVPKALALLKAPPKALVASKAAPKAPAAPKAAMKTPAAPKAAMKTPAAPKASAAPKAVASGSKKPAGGLQVHAAAAQKSTTTTSKKTVTKAQDAKIDVSIGTRRKILISVDLKNGSCTEVKPAGRKRVNCDPAAVSTPKKMKK